MFIRNTSLLVHILLDTVYVKQTFDRSIAFELIFSKIALLAR